MKTLVLVLLLALLGGVASAQPAPSGNPPGPGRVITPNIIEAGRGPDVPPVAKVTKPKDRDKTSSSCAGMALLFWIFAAGTIGGSIFVITRRNLIAAVMGMVATFFAVAALYMMLYANFLAVVQMLVYAGAIMVLFVFVVMILNKPEDEPWALTGLPGKALAGLAMLYLVFRLGGVLWSVKPPEAALLAPPPVDVDPRPAEARSEARPNPDLRQDMADWGSTKAVGANLFDDYLFPFEAVSILLLVAVVGAIAVARPLKDDDEDAAEAVQS